MMINISVRNINWNYLSKNGEEIIKKSDIPVGPDIAMHIADHNKENLKRIIYDSNKEKIYEKSEIDKLKTDGENDAVFEIRLLIAIVKEYPEFKDIFNVDTYYVDDFNIYNCFDEVIATVKFK